MEMMRGALTAAVSAAVLLTTTVAVAANLGPFRNVYVVDFHSDQPASCSAADVDVDNLRAATFFKRARKVDYRVIHDHYNTFPCHAIGVMTYRGQRCDWTLNAGLFAVLHCGRQRSYFACDECQDLLTPAEPKSVRPRS